MKKLFKGRLTYANVVATLALCIAVGGASAFAATQLPKNSVTAKQIKNNAVTTAKLKKEAVTTAKIKNDAVNGAKVAAGSIDTTDLKAGTIPAPVNAYTKGESDARYLHQATVTVVETIGTNIAPPGGFESGIVECPAGYQAIAGGVDNDGILNGKVSASAPTIDGARTEAVADGEHGPPTGWYGAMTTQGGAANVTKAKIVVVCSRIGG
ncbi:MAG TPA: hypothetical protein VFB52_07590 [Solirubrobacterales bacterium]|nr:hypothetical protein [Solirubrobacterales bacterium]